MVSVYSVSHVTGRVHLLSLATELPDSNSPVFGPGEPDEPSIWRLMILSLTISISPSHKIKPPPERKEKKTRTHKYMGFPTNPLPYCVSTTFPSIHIFALTSLPFPTSLTSHSTVCHSPGRGYSTSLARTSDDVLNVLNEIFPLPFHSAMSISGGQLSTAKTRATCPVPWAP